jgi:hypothetical protein
MGGRAFAFDAILRSRRPVWLANTFLALCTLLYLPELIFKTVWLGQGDAQVFFRAGWAIWTGYPLYEVTDRHGWTYHYPPTFALFMGPFANPLPGYAQPWWALPYPIAIVAWYCLNAACVILALHLWARALEGYQLFKGQSEFLQGPLLLRLGPLLVFLPYVGDGMARGQPSPLLLLLVVMYFLLYVEKRTAFAALFFALAVAIKEFPIVLALIPLLRRDWKFLLWTAAWCVALMAVLPMLCVGSAATVDLYRQMWTGHLGGIISGSIPAKLISEVAPGGYDAISVGATAARIAVGDWFNTSPLPTWALAVQYLFDAFVVGAVAVLGHGGFWNLRGAQPARGYPLLAAAAVLFAAVPLMVPVSKPNYVTFAVPLMGVLLFETWRRAGQVVVTARMVARAVIPSLAFVSFELQWHWLIVVGPMTWALLFFGPESLSLVSRLSAQSETGGVDRLAGQHVQR